MISTPAVVSGTIVPKNYIKPAETVSNPVQTVMKNPDNSEKYRKIEFTEGISLLGKGVINQVSGIINSIFENPVKTLAVAGGTTLALAALPFIGIPTAVGGGVLALGFGGYAIGKSIKHAVQFAANNEEGSFDKARKNLEQIGSDTVDLALSVPFIPKAVTQIKNFAQYGKISYNAGLVSELKTSKHKWRTLKNADAELSRDINYRKAVDTELAKLNNMSEAQKTAIKKELLEYNVADEKIAEVVLDEWARVKGVKAKPDLKYDTLPNSTAGEASPANCSITLNDYKHNIISKAHDKFQFLKREQVNDRYEFTYKDKSTGNIVQESIDKKVLDAYTGLYAKYDKLSPQAKRILTTVHEREHIHQYAQISAQNGVDWASPTQRAKDLYQQMMQDIPKAPAGSAKAAEIEAYAKAKNNGTPISYIKNAREIGARNAEARVLLNPGFDKLNNVFVEANKAKADSMSFNLFINAARAQSAANPM